MKFNNELSDAQAERLAILLEEMGEAQQAIGKILRHGLHSWNPTVVGTGTNQDDLARELGDVKFAIQLLTDAGDVSNTDINAQMWKKTDKVQRYLHHQGEEK
jgi:NTP pyrophosphatase (non-canonical NTP hydrolase)